MGLPCFHDLFLCLKDSGQVLPKDVHPFWWYNQAKVSTTIKAPDSQGVVLEPATVKGKGRPKGSQGTKKGSGLLSMYYQLTFALIT